MNAKEKFENEMRTKFRILSNNEIEKAYENALSKCRRKNYSQNDEHKIRAMEIRQDK